VLREHEELGEVMPALAGLNLVGGLALGAVAFVDRRGTGPQLLRRRGVAIGVASLAVVASIVATGQAVRVGHTGVEATWQDVLTGD
jgi:hypothetical protein